MKGLIKKERQMPEDSDQTKGNEPQPPVEDPPSKGSEASPGEVPKNKTDSADSSKAGDSAVTKTGGLAADTTTNVEALATNASKGLPTAQGSSVEALFASTDQLAQVDMNEPQEVLSASGNILNSYYTVALAQSARSFFWAVVASIVGLVLFVFAVYFALTQGSLDAAVVTTIAGAIVQLVAGLQFYLYRKASEQAADHRFSLEKMQRYLLANSLIESLSEPKTKDESRTKLISAMSDEGRATSRSQDNRQDKDAQGRNRSRGRKPGSQEGTPG
jgi:hypothetical protein